MKLNQFITIVILTAFIFSCSSNKKPEKNSFAGSDRITLHQEFKKYFDECNTEGSIAIYDNNRHEWILSDTVGIFKETLPASTFKIINLLIALETNTITDENEVMKWNGNTDTVKYGYRPEIYHDMTVKEAFRVSAVWAFIDLARKIGKENYKKYLTLCSYGNLDLSQTDDDFWNFGAFAVSPLNQVEFLKKMYEGKLPFSKRNIEIVKNVMQTEQEANYTIYAKTGWTREGGINTGWWVGYIENKNGTYFFATRLLQDRKFKSANFGNCRKEITRKIFRDLKIIE